MNILHVVPSYFPAVRYGGPIWSVHGLAAAQAALGHDVSVFTTNADGPGVSPVPVSTPVDLDGVKVTYHPIGFPRRLFRAPTMTAALAPAVAAADVVHLHSVFLWPTLAAARAAKRAGTPYVLSPRGMLVPSLMRAKSSLPKRLWLAAFERRTIRHAAAIHVTALREADDLVELGLPPVRTIELPNGVEPPPIEAAAQVADDIAAVVATPGYALFIGRLNWKKNLGVLIEAVGRVAGLRLVIAGNDEEDHATALRAAIRDHAVEDRVTLIERSVGGGDKEALFAGAAMFVLPSLNENFGNTVLEAMVRSRAVVVSDGAGVAAVVAAADAGIVCPPEAATLADAMRMLAEDEPRRVAMGSAGRAAALEKFGWKTIAEQMMGAYRALPSPG